MMNSTGTDHVMKRFSTELTSCNEKLDSVLFSEPKKILIYGRAASGKTNFILNVIKCSISKARETHDLYRTLFVYISTEGPNYIERAEQLGLLDSENVLYAEALDTLHLISLISTLIRTSLISRVAMIAIDSINFHYRVEASSIDETKRFVTLLTLLDVISSNGIWVLASAQIREAVNNIDDLTHIEPSGFQYLEPWADVIARIEVLHQHRILVVEKPKHLEIPFSIVKEGIAWH